MGRMARSFAPNRILVVDDRPQNVELLKAHLTNAGYVVETATGGQEALDKVAAQLPDLVLLDIVMPDVDGFQVCEKLKSSNDTNFVPVVVITALKESGDKIRALEVGADDFLSKPFDPYELLARVKSLLRIKALHDELEQYNQLLHRTLNRYMAEDVTSLILEDPERYLKLGGEDRVVSVLFADIRGFTRFSERHAATEVVEVLNLVFTALTKTVFEYGGTFDKYLGDAVMAFFGAPLPQSDHAERAVRTGLKIVRELADWNRRREAEGLDRVDVRVAINSGPVVVGDIGSARRVDYTVLGNAVNVTARIEEYVAQPGQVVIGETT